jgi:hypothetical protein
MSDRVHVSIELDVFVDDEEAMRQAAFERMQGAWSSEDDFPFDSPRDVPLSQAIQSLLAAAVPLEITGGRRSQLSIETEEAVSDDSAKDADDDTDAGDSEDDTGDEDAGGQADDDSDADSDADSDGGSGDEADKGDTDDSEDAKKSD